MRGVWRQGMHAVWMQVSMRTHKVHELDQTQPGRLATAGLRWHLNWRNCCHSSVRVTVAQCAFRPHLGECPGLTRCLCPTCRCLQDKPINGRTTYFVSHCWAYKFKDLISLVMRHYDAQPGTSGGLVYQPIYYWWG